MTNSELMQDQDGELVLHVPEQTTFREAMISSGMVTEGKNTDWGHSVIKAGYYHVEHERNIDQRRVILTLAIKMPSYSELKKANIL